MAKMKKRGRPALTPTAAPRPAAADLSPKALRAKMTVPAALAGALDRIVLAGRKVLYSEQMKPQIVQQMQGPGDLGTKIGTGVVGLLAILMSKSNGTFPPQLVVPAAVILCAEAADLLRTAGANVTDPDIARAIAVATQEIMKRSGVKPEQLPQLVQQQRAKSGIVAGAQGQPAPAQPMGA
jgi:hypothetical protein